jgi:predicted peptidase
VYLPEGYGAGQQQWPLVLFLHGMGERGTVLDTVKKHGPPKLVDQGKKFPFILISPQCPPDEMWSVPVLDALLNEVEARYRVDPTRVYVTGLSMGGNGTWRLAIAQPHRFAAIAPICGWADTNAVCALKNLPIWTFHGKKDLVVPFERTEKLVAKLKQCGGNVRFTAYPEAGHDSWTETYENPELYEWLLAQKLGGK